MAKKEVKYAEAVNEIEVIISQLENGELDVDELAEKVKRVTASDQALSVKASVN